MAEAVRHLSNGNVRPPLVNIKTPEEELALSILDVLAKQKAEARAQQEYEEKNHGRCYPVQQGEDGKQSWARCEQGAQEAKEGLGCWSEILANGPRLTRTSDQEGA